MLSHKTDITSYSTDKYPFRQAMQELLNLPGEYDLENYDEGLREVLSREADQSLKLHRKFYAAWDGSWLQDVYHDFVLDQVFQRAGEGVYYQRIPTFRCHMVGNIGVGSWHRDRDFGHGQGEYTHWLPVTPCHDTSTVWIDDSDTAVLGDKDVTPVGLLRPANLKYGELLLFDSINRLHGNFPNKTSATRVGIDFRVIPTSEWEARSTAHAVNARMPFDDSPEGYFRNPATLGRVEANG